MRVGRNMVVEEEQERSMEMTTEQKIEALKDAGFTNRDILDEAKAGRFNEMATLVEPVKS